MIGLALGPYEIVRDRTLFELQMQYFFGRQWTSRLSFEFEIFNEMPLIVYSDLVSNVTVIGMRGSASGPELALQLEFFVWTYIFPLLTDIAPLYETLTEWRIPFLSSAAQHFGNSFFDVCSIPHEFADPILAYLDKQGIGNADKDFILVGIGTGGILAKTIGMLRSRQAFSFWSMLAFEGSYSGNFDFNEMNAVYIINVYNYVGGVFTFRLAPEEPGVANNFGIPWIEGGSIARDTRYRSLCTMFAMCAHQGVLREYCQQVIDDMDTVEAAFSGEEATDTE
jgi:hypothetical protein